MAYPSSICYGRHTNPWTYLTSSLECLGHRCFPRDLHLVGAQQGAVWHSDAELGSDTLWGLHFLICNMGMNRFFSPLQIQLDKRELALAQSKCSINDVCYFYFLKYYYKISPCSVELSSKLQTSVSLSERSGKASNSKCPKFNSWPPLPPNLVFGQCALLQLREHHLGRFANCHP